jgi:hypothetical protein
MKALEKHLAHAGKKNSVWTKREIQAARMTVHRSSPEDGISLAMALQNGGYRITKEQSDFGHEWLRKTMWTSKNKVSLSKAGRCFGQRERDIVKRFKKFTFEGLLYEQNQYAGKIWTLPIYRCHAKNGDYFDYCVPHWGLPEVLN